MTTWWDRHLGKNCTLETFEGWVCDHTAESKRIVREYVAGMRYQSVLDCGAGLCSEFEGYRAGGHEIEYRALDVTMRFVEMAEERGIPITLGSIEAIPFQDDEFDVVYARHVLEHLSSYQTALKEMVRVARREAIVVWFIPPHEGHDKGDRISVTDGDLYHNCYRREGINDFLRQQPGVAGFRWQKVSDNEAILYVFKEGVA